MTPILLTRLLLALSISNSKATPVDGSLEGLLEASLDNSLKSSLDNPSKESLKRILKGFP